MLGGQEKQEKMNSSFFSATATGKQGQEGQAQQRLVRPGRGLFDISGGNHFIMTVRFPNLSSQLLIPLHLHNIYNPQGKEITDFSITQIVGILPSYKFTINRLLVKKQKLPAFQSNSLEEI